MPVAKVAVMRDPFLSDQFCDFFIIPFFIRTFGIPEEESMGSGTKADNRFSRLDVLQKMLELIGRQISKAGKQDHQISIIKCFQTADRLLISRRDITVLIQGIADRHIKSVIAFQDLSQHGHGFFRPIFIVPGYKHNMWFFSSLRFHSN